MYEIRYDSDDRTLRIAAEGFWSVVTVTSFMSEVVARATAIRLRHGRFVALVDLRKGTVHSAATVAILEAMVPRALQISPDPVAVVVSSMLAKLQTARYMKGPNCRLFHSMAEAEDWLATARQDSFPASIRA